MPTNYLTEFATGAGANLPVETTWQGLTERSTGFQTGLARSSYFNRLFSQGAVGAYALGQFVVDYASADADLDGANLYTNLKTALSAYVGGSFLPKSGGTMTGAITRNGIAIQNGYDNGTTTFYGATSYTKGAYFNLYGKDNATCPGQFRLICNDGTNTYSLIGDPSDGSLKWKGNDLLAVNGGIATNGNFLYRNASTGYLRVSGGSSISSGGNIVMRGEGAPTDSGAVILYATNSNKTVYYRFNPDRSIEINGTAKHLAFGFGTYSITNIGAAGYLTTSATSLNIYLPIQIAAGSVTIDSLVASVRVGSGGYTTPGGSTAESIIPVGVTISTSVQDHFLRIALTKSDGWNATNNTTVHAQISSIQFTVSS